MAGKNNKAEVIAPTVEQVAGLRDWFIGNMDEGLEELAGKFAETSLWANIYASIAKPVWREGFNKGEEDVWAHETWDEECIPNPWEETTPYTPADPTAAPFQDN